MLKIINFILSKNCTMAIIQKYLSRHMLCIWTTLSLIAKHSVYLSRISSQFSDFH